DVLNLSFSPITGGEGNIEFIVHLKKSLQEGTAVGIDIPKVVASAHETFHQPK
ncbi:TlyA family rRNA (cytidine-2'-O)-methyltransferase, partial [Listeria monocytogenes]|nr:TlyA family rRNA (cytidine-2'-O)-methyltransferase [Listeria monocytogenes]